MMKRYERLVLILAFVVAAIGGLSAQTAVTNPVTVIGFPTGVTMTVNPSNTVNTSPWLVTVIPTAGQGCTPYHLSGGTGASTNSTSIKGSAGTLCELTVINTTSTLYYLKVYDSAAAPTCSSATNLKHVFPIPHASAAGGGLVRSLPSGEAYANGIGFCVTGGGGDTDNTSAATGVYVEGGYK